MDEVSHLDALVRKVRNAPMRGRRRLVALAGAPASGKSTLAAQLAKALNATGEKAQVVPMDGFHLDNDILRARGLLARKGAPQTFDAEGFVHLVQRLKHEETVTYPLFDRSRDNAIAGAAQVTADCDTVFVEGNYLLFDLAPWDALPAEWDISIKLEVPLQVLEQRLIDRWTDNGLCLQDASARAQENDVPNAQTVTARALPADVNWNGAVVPD